LGIYNILGDSYVYFGIRSEQRFVFGSRRVYLSFETAVPVVEKGEISVFFITSRRNNADPPVTLKVLQQL